MGRQLTMDMDTVGAESRHMRKVADDICGHASLYKSITADVETWPYGAKAAPIDRWVWNNTLYEPEELRIEDKETVAGIVRFKAIRNKVADDFKKVVEAMTMGAIQPHEGGMFATDHMGFADIGPFMSGCSTKSTIEVNWTDSERVTPDIEPWHAWSAVEPTNEYWDTTIDFEGKKFGVKHWGRMSWHDFYTVLRNICADGYEQQVRKVLGANAEHVTLAQYAKTSMFQIHDFALKTVNDGLLAIAMGETPDPLTPKKGRSNEQYTLTASEAACTEFFGKGGNPEIVKAVLGTVHSLKSDPRAADFVKDGRVWFSVNKITEEALRTNAGTIKAKKYENAVSIIDAALVMASGAQVVGRNAKGEPTDVLYLMDAVRVDSVTYGGNTYRDVWGFAVSKRTISEYAIDQGHAYRYPLSDSKEPFTIDTLAINEYLSDVINEARGELYTSIKTGKPRKTKRRTYTVSRSWLAIFARFSPVRNFNSRQKNVMVRKFEEVLTDLVRQESHGRREGRPLYIYAWSKRDGSKGRGKGKYLTLNIEASNELHAVRDGSKEHGAINLQDGEAVKMPDDMGK